MGLPSPDAPLSVIRDNGAADDRRSRSASLVRAVSLNVFSAPGFMRHRGAPLRVKVT